VSSCACGCCAGVAESTPATISNLPGLSALAYRVGTHARFKQTMLVHLSQHTELRALTTREDDDPTIALVDAWASALDVLTFYQERIANEGYLLTAVEPRSVRELARAIGYELGPGVAADTRLAFELETAPGAPESALVKVGTKVQSVPGQDELPQVFETLEEIEARPKWNSLRARTGVDTLSASAAVELWVEGIDTGLRVGDLIAFVGKKRLVDSTAKDWDVRRVTSVDPDADAGRTRIRWADWLFLGEDYVLGPGASDVKVIAFRARAPLFGHNAPDWKAMPHEVKKGYDNVTSQDAHGPDWPNMSLSKVGGGPNTTQVFLDAAYPQIRDGSWAILRAPGVSDALFRVNGASEDSRTDFTMSAKTTRLDLSATPDAKFGLRSTTVYAQSEELRLAPWPAREPVFGDTIPLETPVEPPPGGRTVVVSGKPAYVSVAPEVTEPAELPLDPDDGSFSVDPTREDVFRVLGLEPAFADLFRWHLDNGKGKRGLVYGRLVDFAIAEVPDDAELLTESATLAPVTDDESQDELKLTASLGHVYDPVSLRVAANVARATNGESRSEILGGGDASVPFQRFRLKDEPLTFVQSAGATGSASSLAVRVNGVMWHEVPALYGRAPRDRVYTVRIGDDGTATVEFGDGATGARLPSAADNVRATYRVGTGLAGQVAAGKLTTPMGAPLGVKAVTNPLPATGAEDPETGERARQNAPLTVLTFERIVSLDDAEAFAAAFAGIGKAQATRLWDGEAEIVHITVALADGSPPAPDSSQLANLRKAMREKGDPHLLLRIDPYVAWPFAVEAAVFVDPDYVAADVLDAVCAALTARFSFEQRAFGQSVAESEVIAAMQRVEGVVGVDLQWLHLVGESTLLPAQGARFVGGQIVPAQLLTLAPKDVAVTAS
jgi:hypothetical protein